MPSYLHELLLLLFRNRSGSAADLLRVLNVQLPEYDEVRTESSDLNDLQPAEYRADLVLFLVRRAQNVLGAVARWAGRSIELGPGTQCKPWVIGPSNMPMVTELQDAQENVELAVLSAIEHGQGGNTRLVARIASAAILASADIDAERSRLYLDLLIISLLENAPEALETTMNSLIPGYEYQSPFARRYFGQGKAEGRMEGRTEIILKLLALRFGQLPDETQTRVRSAQDAQLDAVAERMLTAQTLQEALGPLY